MIKVINPGFYSTIQDLGRIGYQHYGVPYSGVMDSYCASLANSLLGNNKDMAVIEMTMTGAKLEFLVNTNICISGANMLPRLNAVKIALNKCIAVNSGDILSFGKLNIGFRCYLAICGGINTETVMNSRSMYKGITKYHVLAKHNNLLITESLVVEKKYASIRIHKTHFSSKKIEVFKGPEFDRLSDSQVEKLKTNSFTISKENNRMAYQLEEPLENSLEPIITSSVLPGTVQLTPSGRLIVLMRDCQTTGGYPRVLQLKESAINVLAQKYTGQNICFNLLDY